MDIIKEIHEFNRREKSTPENRRIIKDKKKSIKEVVVKEKNINNNQLDLESKNI